MAPFLLFISLFFSAFISTETYAETHPETYPETTVSVYALTHLAPKASIALSSDILPISEVDIASEVSAKVIAIYCEAGDLVDKGQALVQLDDSQQKLIVERNQALLASFEAERKIAKLDRDRIKKLLQQKTASQEQYDQAEGRLLRAEADVRAQKAELKLANVQLEKYRLTAPFQGLISERVISAGDWLQTGETTVKLTSMNPLRVVTKIPQRHYTSIKAAHASNNLHIQLDRENRDATNANSIERLSVKQVIAKANNSRQFEIWADLANSNRDWLPGMSVQSEVLWRAKADNAPQTTTAGNFTVPLDALVQRASAPTRLWKIKSAEMSTTEQVDIRQQNTEYIDRYTVSPIEVEVLSRHAGYATVRPLIRDSLNLGDRIVVVGNESLRDKQTVMIQNPRID